MNMLSHPTRVRGLKPQDRAPDIHVSSVAPQGVRGLKQR